MKNTTYLILIIILSAGIGFMLGEKKEEFLSPPNSPYASVNRLSRLIEYISEDYVDQINTDSLVGSIISDVVAQLDPHSVYIPAQEQQLIAENMRGNFEGIGVSFFMVGDTIAVVRVLEGGPSEKMGLQSGDRILRADLDTLYNKSLESTQVIGVLKGPKGSKVNLEIYRKATDSLFSIDLTRGPVPLPSVPSYYMMNEQVGYIKVTRFSQTTYEEFEKAMTNLLRQGMQALLLDLRGNPGGYMLPAKQIANTFLSRGKPIVIVESNKGVRERTIADDGGLFEEGALYVMVDEQSASASEIVAGAIQDNDRGWIVGRRTFGKGLVQQQLPLGKGDQVRLTTARYYTPTGRSIQRPYEADDKETYFADLQNRFENGEMQDVAKIPLADSLAFKTPKGRTVYGGGGIVPDFYVPNPNTQEQEWNNYWIQSNLVNHFLFLQMDKDRLPFQFSSPAQFYSEPLPEAASLLKAFESYSQERNLSLNLSNKELLLNSFKSYMALQLFDENMYYRIKNQEDPFVKKALLQLEEGF
ncbi:MAG: S41 family peptidase [Flavobacteriaceae bacterium]|jgi:carboxyl-terminal processing protease